MSDGQKEEPGATVKQQSAALWNNLRHRGVNKQGTTTMWYVLVHL
jgi:hypothetical protein